MSIKLLDGCWQNGPDDRTELLILMALADRASQDGTRCYPSMNDIAERSRTSKRHAKRVVNRLEEKGWLKVVESGGGRGNSNRYKLNADRLTEGTAHEDQPDDPPPEDQKGDTGSRNTESEKGDTRSRNPEKGDTRSRNTESEKGDTRVMVSPKRVTSCRKTMTLVSPKPLMNRYKVKPSSSAGASAPAQAESNNQKSAHGREAGEEEEEEGEKKTGGSDATPAPDASSTESPVPEAKASEEISSGTASEETRSEFLTRVDEQQRSENAEKILATLEAIDVYTEKRRSYVQKYTKEQIGETFKAWRNISDAGPGLFCTLMEEQEKLHNNQKHNVDPPSGNGSPQRRSKAQSGSEDQRPSPHRGASDPGPVSGPTEETRQRRSAGATANHDLPETDAGDDPDPEQTLDTDDISDLLQNTGVLSDGERLGSARANATQENGSHSNGSPQRRSKAQSGSDDPSPSPTSEDPSASTSEVRDAAEQKPASVNEETSSEGVPSEETPATASEGDARPFNLSPKKRVA